MSSVAPNMSWEELKRFLERVSSSSSRLNKTSFEDRMRWRMRNILPSGSNKGSQEFNDAFIEAARMTSNEWRDQENSEPPGLISDDEEDSD